MQRIHKVFNGPLPGMSVGAIPEGLVPYNMIETNDDSIEINMYGDVVDEMPIDWQTGEPIEGLYIALDKFIKDLDVYKNKKNITIHLNSVGGSLTAGLAIKNRLSQLPGNVVTICDALAASAAGIILQGGKTRLVFPGSQVMIHGASSFLFGYYQVQDLTKISNMLKAANKTVVDVYVEKTGKDAAYIKNLMDKETWMTGQEAIDNGFADGFVKTTDKAKITMSADKTVIYGNGVPMSAIFFKNLPANIAIQPEVKDKEVTTGTDQPDVIENQINGGKKMTLEELMASDPELVQQIQNEAINTVQTSANTQTDDAVKNAVAAERKRLQEIESIENSIADKKLVESAKYGETQMSAQELAFKAMQQNAVAGANFLEGMKNDTANSGAANVSGSPVCGDANEQEAKDIADGAALIAGVVKKEDK